MLVNLCFLTKIKERGKEMRASRGEIKIEEILSEYDFNFKMEYSFPDLKSSSGRLLRFDFVIFDDNDDIDFIIEYQGRQHYEPTTRYGGKRGYYQQHYNDELKKRYCAFHGYKLVEIPYTDYEKITYEYILKKAGII